jgi:hypothetical protein
MKTIVFSVRIKDVGPSDTHVLNLRGLLCRLIGERAENTDAQRIYQLTSADRIFRKIKVMTNGNMGTEKCNNRAIALIRRFELSKDAKSLDDAELVLDEIDFDARSHPLNNFLALPKGLNNRGNIGKQRLSDTKDLHWYSYAIEAYGKAEKYWNETETAYESAMIQKNKADVGLFRTVEELALPSRRTSFRDLIPGARPAPELTNKATSGGSIPNPPCGHGAGPLRPQKFLPLCPAVARRTSWTTSLRVGTCVQPDVSNK